MDTTADNAQHVRELARSLDCLTSEELRSLAGGITPGTEEAWAKRGTGPSYFMFGKARLYPRKHLAEHLQTKLRLHTAPEREGHPLMPAAVVDLDAERKSWTTLVARAALRGFQLWRSDSADGPQRYFLGKWGMVRCMADLAEVDRVLEQVGVA